MGVIGRGEQIGEAEVLLEVHEEIENPRLDRDVERRHRFVANQEIGPYGEHPGNADALPLAARELMEIAVAIAAIEADPTH